MSKSRNSGKRAAKPPVASPRPALVSWPLQVFAALVLAFAVYAPALFAPFFSDDLHYVQTNAYIHDFSIDNILAVWSPFSPVVGIVENYAPVHLSLHGLAWQLFGVNVLGHHALNVVLHALAAVLLVGFFRRVGIAERVALFLGAVFLVHPANIEAVAWVSQLKTTSAMVLVLGALALQPKRPAAGLACFALALLAKPTAAVGLPVAALLLVHGTRTRTPELPSSGWLGDSQARWLLGWLAVFLAFAVVEFAAFFDTAGSAPPLYSELDLRIRMIAAVAARYLAMAASGFGLAVFHDPPAARSWLDPWFLLGLTWIGFVAWRCWVSWRERSMELVCWCFAVVSFVPISGVIALPHAVADRYLYFMLPGLLGAFGFALSQRYPAALPKPVMLGAVAVVLLLGVAANRHTVLWQNAESLLAHTEARYPDGKVATLRSARRAALAGDVDAVVRSLRSAMGRGYDRLDTLASDPAYRALRGRPAFDEIIDELAQRLIERGDPTRNPSQVDLRVRGQALFVVGRGGEAIEALEQALDRGGPYSDAIRTELDRLKRIEGSRARR